MPSSSSINIFLFLELVVNFFALQPGQGLQTHFQNRVGLDVGEFEFFD